MHRANRRSRRRGSGSATRAIGPTAPCASAGTRPISRALYLKLFAPLRPTRGVGLSPLQVGPVRSQWGEDIGDGASLRACDRVVRNVAWDDVSVAGPELALLASDSHRDDAGDHEPQLLVLMVVLRENRARIEVDHGHRHAFAFHGARSDAVPNPVRAKPAERLEGAHSTTRSMMVAVPMPPPQHMVSRP